MNGGRLSVIIPAHNEEAVIERTLDALLGAAREAEFEVIVVCNGCTDDTARRVRRRMPSATVVELEEASKTAAINAGLGLASGGAVLLLDADIELETEAARVLYRAVRRPGVEAAIGHMEAGTEGAHWLVRAFYRVWMEHPYLRNGKFAAAIALSPAGLARIGKLPAVTADDTYLRRVIPSDRVAVVDSVRFLVRTPRTVESLVRVRARSYRGNRELDTLGAGSRTPISGEARGLLARVATQPRLWPAAGAYLVITLAARFRGRWSTDARWERDLTTRSPSTS